MLRAAQRVQTLGRQLLTMASSGAAAGDASLAPTPRRQHAE
jgi:hypothetical protein